MNHAIILLIFLSLIINTAVAGTPESWIRLDPQIFDDTYANLDIVSLGGQQFRAYYMRGGSIGTALSIDDGVTFTDEGTVVNGEHHALLKLGNNSYRMYYSTLTSDDLLSATSPNGTTFSQEDGTRVSGIGQIIHPCAVALTDGSFKIFYDQEVGANPNFGKRIRSLSCDSSGLSCVQDSGVRIRGRRDCEDLSILERRKLKQRGILCDVELVFSPFIEFNSSSSQYRLYFTAEGNNKNSGVYLATSKNGQLFKIKNKVLGVNLNTPVEDGNLGLAGNPQDPFIITQNAGTRRMYVWETDDGIYSATINQ